MQTFKLLFLLFTSLLYSCNDSTFKTKSLDSGFVIDLSPNNDNVLSYSGSYALLIGQTDYSYWGDLNSIPSELNDVESVLKKQGFIVKRYSNLNSRDLSNTFKDFIDQYGLDKDNRLLFFYSGHGHSRGDKGYIVPVDAPNPYSDDKGFVRKAIAMNQVVTWARNIESKHALFLFDSCFSGTVFKTKDFSKPKQISLAMRLPVRQFITAGSANEKVPAKSTFTPAFVHALAYADGDINKDGYVTGMELGFYLWSEVPKHTDQIPQYGKIKDFNLSRGDFLFKVQKKSKPIINDVVVESDNGNKDHTTVSTTKVFQDSLRDGSLGPKMVKIPAGSFRMGDIQGGGFLIFNQPVKMVSVGEFAMGMYEVTVGEFSKFVNATGYRTDAEKEGHCNIYRNRVFNSEQGYNWRNPNFSQNNNHPVTCISWNDANAYTKWLSNQTGKIYRLPTEAEWEYAARAGTETKYWWGNAASHEYTNYGLAQGKDRWKYTSPVGSFSANQFGLYDTLGNLREWTCSEYESGYNGREKQCVTNAERLSLRGGSWYNDPMEVRSASRYRDKATNRDTYLGFRISRQL
jgi:formylglycine-generating enzyme required for sulfatase activity